MQQDRITVGEAHQDVFAAAPEAGDARAGQALLQTFGQRPAQVGAMGGRAHDDTAFQPLLEATHHGLDLGEFRHWGVARYRWRE